MIENIINKKAERAKRRMFFRIDIPNSEQVKGGTLTLQVYGLGMPLYYGKVEVEKGKSRHLFSLDLPWWRFAVASKIKWQWKGYKLKEGEILKSDKFERLI